MKSLFIRIFLTLWLALTLIAAGFALIYVTREPSEWMERGRYLMKEALERHGLEMQALLLAGRTDEAESVRREFQEGARLRTWFVAPNLQPEDLAEEGREAARQAVASHEPTRLEGEESEYLAVPFGEAGGGVIVAEVPKPRPTWMRVLGPDPIGLRLLVVLLVCGLVSYGLARYLSKPVVELRRATRALAEGNRGVRVAPQMGRRSDEIAALARDFDSMADRVAGLIDDQRQLLRDVSHELRSPLARLAVALELAKAAAGEGAAPQLQRIEREAERLNSLIGEMLQAAQVDAAGSALEREPVQLDALVKQIVADADFEGQHQGRGVDLVEAQPVELTGIPESLRRAVENVVRNAVRFTPEGTRVEVRVARENGAAGERATIRVRDRGPGVPEADLERIFQPFVRVGPARDRQSGGTGIGLAVTDRAVRQHGGTVAARNAEGGGLEVTLSLPLQARAGGAS